jgi:YVTN family beta-propeller protein
MPADAFGNVRVRHTFSLWLGHSHDWEAPVSAGSPWWPRLVALLVFLAAVLVLGDLSGPRGEAAPATPQPQATVQRGAVRAGTSPTVLGDINNDGIVDIRDYGLWRQSFGATDCGNPADLNGDCIVDIRDYGVWRQNFGQTGPTVTPTPTGTSTPTSTPTATPTLPGRAYVANSGSNNVTVIDTTTNTVVGAPIPVGTHPSSVGVDPTVHRAYVANQGSNNVTVIDTTTNAVIGTPIPVGSAPQAVGIGP